MSDPRIDNMASGRKRVKLTKAQADFLSTLTMRNLFVRGTQVAHLRPLVRAGLVETRQDESGFYCAVTDAGRALVAGDPL